MTIDPTAPWRISSFSGSGGNCVEVAPCGEGATAVRNSKRRHAGTLVLPANAFAAFVAGVRAGEFDAFA